jgi:hypothetical protein
MSKPNKARYNLETLRKAHADKNGGDAISFEFAGEAFEIAAPGFWPDAAKVALKEGDDIGAARALMGERYDVFTDKGGRADDIMIVVSAYADEQGIDLGE